MRVIGCNFTKISVNRKEKLEQIEKISTNIEFLNVEKEDVEALKDGEILKVTFSYKIEYEPDNANIEFEGIMMLTADSDVIKEILASWKNKKIENDKLRIPLFNTILHKCNVKALSLEEDLGLPFHVKMPRIQKKQDNYVHSNN